MEIPDKYKGMLEKGVSPDPFVRQMRSNYKQFRKELKMTFAAYKKTKQPLTYKWVTAFAVNVYLSSHYRALKLFEQYERLEAQRKESNASQQPSSEE